jgi:hypothetical protein
MKDSWVGAVNAGQFPVNEKDNDIHQNTNPLTAQDYQQHVGDKPFTGFDKSGAPIVNNPQPVLTPPILVGDKPYNLSNPIFTPQPVKINPTTAPIIVKHNQNILLNDKELFHQDERELISPKKSDVAKLLSFKTGGVISGKSGEPKIIKAHAGEVVLPEKTAKELRKLLNKKVTTPKRVVRKKKVKGKFKFVKEKGGIRRYFNGKESV